MTFTLTARRDMTAFGRTQRSNSLTVYRVNDSVSLLTLLLTVTDPVYEARIMKQLGRSTREIAEAMGRSGGAGALGRDNLEQQLPTTNHGD